MYKTLREVDGVQYITVKEHEEIVGNLLSAQVKSALNSVENAFDSLRKTTQDFENKLLKAK